MLQITDLPYDVVLEVMKYLNTSDLLLFCEAFPVFSKYFQEKSIARNMNFCRKFSLNNFNICKFVTTTVRPEFIQILNINCLYWIPAQDLRNCIKKMTNLESLIALDTKLGLGPLDCEVYKNLKLQRIALTVDIDKDFDHCPEEYLPFIKSLVFKYSTTKYIKEEQIFSIYRFLLKIHNTSTLEEVWFIDIEANYQLNYFHIAHILSSLKRFVIKSKITIPLFNFKHLGLSTVFEKRKLDCNEIIFVKNWMCLKELEDPIENNDNTPLDESNPWNVLANLHCGIPYGVSDAMKLAKEFTLETIQLEELNFYHTPRLCIDKYNKAAIRILQSPNAYTIKRLSVPSCFFIQENESNKESSTCVGFKRTRRGVAVSSSHPFKKIVDKLTCLEDLEVWFCEKQQVSGEQVFNAYNAINCFTNLKKLTIEVSVLSNGSYLNDVINNCTHLQSLRIVSLGANSMLNYNIGKSIRNARNLKDFYYNTHHIAIDNFFQSFNEIEMCKLERVFLNFDYVEKFSVEPLEQFLKNNSQLIFFVLLIKECTKEVMKQVQATLNRHKNKDPAKVFYAKRNLEDFSACFPIPLAHRDLLDCKTEIANINVYRHYY